MSQPNLLETVPESIVRRKTKSLRLRSCIPCSVIQLEFAFAASVTFKASTVGGAQ